MDATQVSEACRGGSIPPGGTSNRNVVLLFVLQPATDNAAVRALGCGVVVDPVQCSTMSAVILAAGRERSVARRHPWVFSGAIARINGSPGPGATVDVRAADGSWLARGTYSPRSQIAVRIWTFDETEPIDADLLRARLGAAIARRRILLDGDEVTAYRLVHAESDGLPGVIVDRYGEWLVCQLSTAGAESWKSPIVAALSELWPCAGIYERSDVEARKKEGLGQVTGVLAGKTPPPMIDIRENGVSFLVDC